MLSVQFLLENPECWKILNPPLLLVSCGFLSKLLTVGLETLSPGCGPEPPPGCGPGDPPGVGLETPPGQTPQLPPWVWTWRPPNPPWPDPSTSQAGIPPPWRPAARHAGIPPAMHAGIPPPPPVNRITDTCKKITLPQLLCGR